MKAEYCETKHTHANIKKHLLEIIDLKIHKVLQNIPQHRYSRMEDLHDLLHKRKTIGGLQHSLKHAIFTRTTTLTQPSFSRSSKSSTSSNHRISIP